MSHKVFMDALKNPHIIVIIIIIKKALNEIQGKEEGGKGHLLHTRPIVFHHHSFGVGV